MRQNSDWLAISPVIVWVRCSIGLHTQALPLVCLWRRRTSRCVARPGMVIASMKGLPWLRTCISGCKDIKLQRGSAEMYMRFLTHGTSWWEPE